MMRPRRSRAQLLVATGVAAIIGLCLPAVPTTAAAGFVNWPAYLHGPTHSSTSTATAITTANAGKLEQAWTFLPGKPPVATLGRDISASPTVYDGVVYIGANNGTFYALDEATGAVIWQRALGYEETDCGYRGITATATVAVPAGGGKPTVYVSGGSGTLYALDAATGTVDWTAVIAAPSGSGINSYYDWSSPTVSGGHVYLGVAGSCADHIRGALLEFSQATGQRLAAYYTVPSGDVGGSVWSSAAVASDGDVYLGTGNDLPPTPGNAGTSESILELNGQTLAELGGWQLPLAAQPSDDDDFGASVSLFDATLNGSTSPTGVVGECNKNGVFYLLRQSDLAAGPVWQLRIAAGATTDSGGTSPAACLAAAVPDGADVFVAGSTTTINGTSFPGSVRSLDAATGRVQWATGLPAEVIGTPTLDAAGVLSVATFGSSSQTSADYLINAATGAILATVSNGDSQEFAQPIFADGYLFLATQTTGLLAYKLPS